MGELFLGDVRLQFVKRPSLMSHPKDAYVLVVVSPVVNLQRPYERPTALEESVSSFFWDHGMEIFITSKT
jgi:hypothetical protein